MQNGNRTQSNLNGMLLSIWPFDWYSIAFDNQISTVWLRLIVRLVRSSILFDWDRLVLFMMPASRLSHSIQSITFSNRWPIDGQLMDWILIASYNRFEILIIDWSSIGFRWSTGSFNWSLTDIFIDCLSIVDPLAIRHGYQLLIDC